MKQAVVFGMIWLCLIVMGCVTVSLKPEVNLWPEYSQAKDLMMRADYKKALLLAEERLETHPNDAHACWVKGRTYYFMGNWDKAIEWLQKTEDLSPSWREQYTGPLIEKVRQRQRLNSNSPNDTNGGDVR